ncbi:uncharacterized protein JCM6883_003081 [Sporobolomyces salmoneus]|uniref:uncharacterized protein n=1 Tax=Sporobolomyces salmoneus TaxID=183962 RepID=UPI00317E1756
MFHFPPLTKHESEFFKQYLKGELVVTRLGMMAPGYVGHTFEEYVNYAGYTKLPFDELIDAITVGSETLLPEPYLTAVTVIARGHLTSEMRKGPKFHPATPAEIYLGNFSLGASAIFATLGIHRSPAPDRFDNNPSLLRQKFTQTNDFFRALLDYSAMYTMNYHERIALRSEVIPSLKRLLAADTSLMGEHSGFLAESLQMTASRIYL